MNIRNSQLQHTMNSSSNSQSMKELITQRKDLAPLLREDFTCRANQSFISLGSMKNKASNPCLDFDPDLTSHNDRNYYEITNGLNSKTHVNYKWNQNSGINDTKFGKGFTRKSSQNIINPVADNIREHLEMNLTLSQNYGKLRTEKLIKKDNISGYNVITGERKNDGRILKPDVINIRNHGVSKESVKHGIAIMADSGSKFFGPQYSGVKQEYRQAVLTKEGVNIPRTSSIIQLGKHDLPSYGIEDCFSKSQYTKTSYVTQQGLYEKREPGKFTPRKVINNPSGDPAVLGKWSTGESTFNKAAGPVALLM